MYCILYILHIAFLWDWQWNNSAWPRSSYMVILLKITCKFYVFPPLLSHARYHEAGKSWLIKGTQPKHQVYQTIFNDFHTEHSCAIANEHTTPWKCQKLLLKNMTAWCKMLVKTETKCVKMSKVWNKWTNQLMVECLRPHLWNMVACTSALGSFIITDMTVDTWSCISLTEGKPEGKNPIKPAGNENG